MVTSCVLSKKGEALLREGLRLVLVSADGGKPRVVGNTRIDGLNFAFLHKNGAGRASIYVVSQRINALERAVVFRRLRADSPTLQEEWAKTAMQLKASAAKWIGATVEKTDFLIEVQPIEGGLELGGIFVHRARGGLRNVVPLEPVVLPVGQGRPGKKVDKADEPDPSAPSASGDAGTGAAGRSGSASPRPAPGRTEKKPARP